MGHILSKVAFNACYSFGHLFLFVLLLLASVNYLSNYVNNTLFNVANVALVHSLQIRAH